MEQFVLGPTGLILEVRFFPENLHDEKRWTSAGDLLLTLPVHTVPGLPFSNTQQTAQL